MSYSKSGEKLRPAFLTDKRGLGGGETSLLNLLATMNCDGVRPIFLGPDGDLFREAARLNLDVYPVEYPDVHMRAGCMPTFSIRTIIRIALCFLNERVDIVHAESLLGLYYGGLAAYLTRKPLVATYHGYWPLKSRVNRLFLRWFCQRIYPVSKAVETELMTIFSNGERRVQTIPLGVNTRFLEPLPPRQEARRHLGLPLVRPIVLHVARFQTIKGHHHLLDALALMVKEKGDSAPLVLFVGDVLKPPSKEELDCKARIECRAALPDLQPHVHFLGHRRDVPLIMRAADVVVSPSDFESFGMSLIEAMTVGTPVVATDAGGPSEIIEHGKTGLLVRPGDSGALAAGIRQVLAHSESSARMADAGREVALSRYCPQRRCATLLQEYRDLMGQRTVTKRETQL